MPVSSADLVDLVRDFMAAHGALTKLSQRFRDGALRFEELRALIGDDDRSVLFRLKERSHAAFRRRAGDANDSTRGELLFDLTVGSLFHEAMKFRESFYQQEIYGPQVRALESESTSDGDALFQEFEKILASVSERLAEGMQETLILADQTAGQLRSLLTEQVETGVVTRHLIENAATVEAIFDCPLDAFLTEIEGSAALGFERAGRSYLTSGFYPEAHSAWGGAIERGGDAARLGRLAGYAAGMAAYLSGDFADCVVKLDGWYENGRDDERELEAIARAAVSKIEQLADGANREATIAAAAALVARIREAAAPA